ncbi:MAG: hypothetical protein HQ495_10625 [Alphaproteobacteria bacterium]|nr:hypothetical protein [Alphaproteobacteria bacterium]
MDNTSDPMTLNDFNTLLDRCGPHLRDWPTDVRTAAQALLAESAAAGAALREAEDLERLLALVPGPAPSAALEARVAALTDEKSAHWIWMMVARPVWRPALLAAAMLGGVYLGAAALPTNVAFGDGGFDLTGVAGGGETLGIVESWED